MQENFGWVKIAKHTRAESLDEMRHAELRSPQRLPPARNVTNSADTGGGCAVYAIKFCPGRVVRFKL
jgi:hypothetical protein